MLKSSLGWTGLLAAILFVSPAPVSAEDGAFGAVDQLRTRTTVKGLSGRSLTLSRTDLEERVARLEEQVQKLLELNDPQAQAEKLEKQYPGVDVTLSRESEREELIRVFYQKALGQLVETWGAEELSVAFGPVTECMNYRLLPGGKDTHVRVPYSLEKKKSSGKDVELEDAVAVEANEAEIQILCGSD